MANHRPKSLSELNQVYDKAIQAQRAIIEGSQSLSDEAPVPEAPSQNIFDELRQQAERTKKTEIYDSEIADIANDFLKRYARPEPKKAPAAPKQLRRPAPSIQSLYHTPVKADQEQNGDIAITQEPAAAIAPQTPPAVITRPKPLESIEAPAPEEKAPAVVEAEAEESAPYYEAPAAAQQEAAAPTVIYPTDHTPPAPPQRITSAERIDLINEYKRVMSDDDDYYFDDDEDYSKPKKASFWSRIKKRRQDDFEYEATPQPTEEAVEDEDEDDALDMTNIYSDFAGDTAEAPVTDEDDSEAVPMSVYDYIEADLDYTDEEETSPETVEEAVEQEVIPEAVEEVAEEEIIPEAVEEVVEEEIIPEIIEEVVEEEVVPEAVEEASPLLTVADYIAEDFSEEEDESEIEEIIPEEEDAPADEVVVYPTEEEDNPTAGMVFDDIFSVSDESKRSYTGGDWGPSYKENTYEAEAEEEEAEAPSYDEPQPEKNVKTRKKDKKSKKASSNKKGGTLRKVLLSFVLVILIAVTGTVTALGSIIGVNTGRLFGDNYRAFCADRDFTLCGITKGDLVLTQDLDTNAQSGSFFVYVSHQSQSFMVGKLTGTTVNLTGDALYIAENEAGRTLVLREDTLGTVSAIYSGMGTPLSMLSANYILIDAALLLLIIAVIVLLVFPFGKKDKKADAQPPYPADTADDEVYDEEAQSDEEPADEYDEDAIDPDDYDTDDIDEELFSNI